MQTKRVPLRQCTGCGEMKPKKELVRVVRSPEGEISLDLIGKAAGRGAYLCRDAACLAKAIKIRALERALEAPLNDTVKTAMESEIETHDGPAV